MEPDQKHTLAYWMGSIDATLTSLNKKLDSTVIALEVKHNLHEKRLAEYEEKSEKRLSAVERKQAVSDTRTGLIGAGAGLTIPLIVHKVMDFFGIG